AEIDAAQGDEEREGERGAPGPPPKPELNERRDGEGAGSVAARERGVELRVAPVAREVPDGREDIARPRTAHRELDRLRDHDRGAQQDQQVERRPAVAPPPEG